jgi:hypothetical protein
MDYTVTPSQHPLLTNFQKFQHPTYHQVDRLGRIVDAVFLADGAIVVPPPDQALVSVVLGGGNLALTSEPQPLKPAQHWTRSVMIQSLRSDGSENDGILWIGSVNGQFYGLRVGDFIQIDSPAGRSIDLNKIYVRSPVPGTQVNFITMD